MQINSTNTPNFTGYISVNKRLISADCPYGDKIRPHIEKCFEKIMHNTPDDAVYVPKSLNYVWRDNIFGKIKKGVQQNFRTNKYLMLTMFDVNKGQEFSYPIFVSGFSSGKKRDIIRDFDNCKVGRQLSKFARKIVAEANKKPVKNPNASYKWADEACKNAIGQSYNKIV